MFLSRTRSNRQIRIAPLMRCGGAPQRWTAQLEFSSGQSADVHLPSLKLSLAKNADPLVIERFPAPVRVAYAQDQEPIIEIDMGDHMHRAVCYRIQTHNRRAG